MSKACGSLQSLVWKCQKAKIGVERLKNVCWEPEETRDKCWKAKNERKTAFHSPFWFLSGYKPAGECHLHLGVVFHPRFVANGSNTNRHAQCLSICSTVLTFQVHKSQLVATKWQYVVTLQWWSVMEWRIEEKMQERRWKQKGWVDYCAGSHKEEMDKLRGVRKTLAVQIVRSWLFWSRDD